MAKLIPDENGVLTVDPLPDAAELSRFYAEKYFDGRTLQYPGQYGPDDHAYFDIKHRILEYYLKNARSPRMLDIGSGEGFTTAYFHARGFDISAADFSRNGFEAQNPETLQAVPFHQGDIVGEEVFPGETFDVITCNHVIEHVIDLYPFLERLHAKLRPGGLLFVELPNEFNVLQQAWLERTGTAPGDAPWVVPPEHLRYFSPQSLAAAMASRGFETVRLLAEFPIDLFLLHEDTDYYATGFGRTAHALRIRTAAILARDIEAYIEYSAALLATGAGRDMIGIFRKA